MVDTKNVASNVAKNDMEGKDMSTESKTMTWNEFVEAIQGIKYMTVEGCGCGIEIDYCHAGCDLPPVEIRVKDKATRIQLGLPEDGDAFGLTIDQKGVKQIEKRTHRDDEGVPLSTTFKIETLNGTKLIIDTSDIGAVFA